MHLCKCIHEKGFHVLAILYQNASCQKELTIPRSNMKGPPGARCPKFNNDNIVAIIQLDIRITFILKKQWFIMHYKYYLVYQIHHQTLYLKSIGTALCNSIAWLIDRLSVILRELGPTELKYISYFVVFKSMQKLFSKWYSKFSWAQN